MGLEPTILALRSKDATNVLKVFGDFRDKKLGFWSENPYPGLEETSREYGHPIVDEEMRERMGVYSYGIEFPT